QAELSATIRYFALKESEQDLGGGVRLRTKYLNHPILVLGYRFEFEGRVICTVYDHEPYQNVFDVKPDAPGYDADAVKEGADAAAGENQKVLRFMQGADLLVHDAQYTKKEWLAGKQGWGHSTFEWARDAALRAGVKHLVLFHHDPDRSDAKLEKLGNECRASIAGKSRMQVSIAQEGRTFEV
ncbi:MAG: MBL fold metallo-hydrolase, partial [Spirochaetes bacterium]|nr:MBL fold metallo-hydrolase [Spirochaetota bacterium]